MTHLFKDTLTATASLYLDYSGYEITRAQFLATIAYDAAHPRGKRTDIGWILYIGPGFTKWQVAVYAGCASDAENALEDWCCKNDRLDEIGRGPDVDENEWGEYELYVEKMPDPIMVMPAELE